MRIVIEIDGDVLTEAQRLLGTHTQDETIEVALREVGRQRRRGLLSLRGRVRWEGDLGDKGTRR